MKLNQKHLSGLLVATFAITAMLTVTPSYGQDKRGADGSGHASAGKAKGGGQAGGKSGNGRAQKSTAARSTGGARTSSSRSAMSGRSNASHSTGTRTATQTQGRSQSGTRTGGGSRPMRMQAGRPMSASNWRSSNPSWSGGYFFHNGGYYYDAGFSYPAIMTNEWSAIAAISGGVALLGVLNNDPRLVFAGTVGALYSYSQYQLDLKSSDPEIRMRAAYFGKPYFWRDGVRYDRITVTSNGVNSYEFRRH